MGSTMKSLWWMMEARTRLGKFCKKKAPKIVFEGFGTYSLEISVTLFVSSKDFTKFQMVKQEINLGILKILEKEGIELASSVK